MSQRKLSLARSLRRRPVLTERRLWVLLRDRRLEGLKFRRQVPIGVYVVDFMSVRHRLVIEADGPFHDPDRDATRDAWLMSQGFRVLRFKNVQIEVWPDRVLDEILKAASFAPIYSGSLADCGGASGS